MAACRLLLLLLLLAVVSSRAPAVGWSCAPSARRVARCCSVLLAPRQALRPRGGASSADTTEEAADPAALAGRAVPAEEMCCCDNDDCPHAHLRAAAAEDAQRRRGQETLAEHVKRLERGEPLGPDDLPADLAHDLTLAFTDGRLDPLFEPTTPWWLQQPFGNTSAHAPPAPRAARSAGAGVIVEETRAELTHNGGHTLQRGWLPAPPEQGRAEARAAATTSGDVAGSRAQRWGMMWAQDPACVVVSFPLPAAVTPKAVRVQLCEAGRRLRVCVGASVASRARGAAKHGQVVLCDDYLFRAVRSVAEDGEGYDNWGLVHLDGVKLLKISLDKKRRPLTQAPATSTAAAEAMLWPCLVHTTAGRLGQDAYAAAMARGGAGLRSLDQVRILSQRAPGTPRVPEGLDSLVGGDAAGEAGSWHARMAAVFAYCAVFRHVNGLVLDEPLRAAELMLDISGLQAQVEALFPPAQQAAAAAQAEAEADAQHEPGSDERHGVGVGGREARRRQPPARRDEAADHTQAEAGAGAWAALLEAMRRVHRALRRPDAPPEDLLRQVHAHTRARSDDEQSSAPAEQHTRLPAHTGRPGSPPAPAPVAPPAAAPAVGPDATRDVLACDTPRVHAAGDVARLESAAPPMGPAAGRRGAGGGGAGASIARLANGTLCCHPARGFSQPFFRV